LQAEIGFKSLSVDSFDLGSPKSVVPCRYLNGCAQPTLFIAASSTSFHSEGTNGSLSQIF
jgi:hypothetical protein